MSEYQGGCSCGSIRFSTSKTPLRVGVCHCLDCRKHHGAAFYAAAIYSIEDVKITGDAKAYKGRYFCSECGSSVFAITDDEIELHLGSFDEPNQFKPTYECWTIRRENWLAPIDGAEQFERDRD
jgi:hypothetical protein